MVGTLDPKLANCKIHSSAFQTPQRSVNDLDHISGRSHVKKGVAKGTAYPDAENKWEVGMFGTLSVRSLEDFRGNTAQQLSGGVDSLGSHCPR